MKEQSGYVREVEGYTEDEEEKKKRETKDSSASCLLGVYGPWTEAREPEHMEPICLRGSIRTWRD